MKDFSPELSEYLEDLFQVTNRSSFFDNSKLDRDISIGVIESHIIGFFIKLFEIKHVVEVGTFVGCSTAYISSQLPDDGSITTIDNSPEYVKIAKANLATLPQQQQQKIIIKQGEALKILNELTSNQFDMIFIDADKTGYPDYLNWAQKHIKKGGLIIADNTLSFGNVHIPRDYASDNKMAQAIAKFNQELANKDKYHTLLVPTNAGLTIAKKID